MKALYPDSGEGIPSIFQMLSDFFSKYVFRGNFCKTNMKAFFHAFLHRPFLCVLKNKVK